MHTGQPHKSRIKPIGDWLKTTFLLVSMAVESRAEVSDQRVVGRRLLPMAGLKRPELACDGFRVLKLAAANRAG